MLCGVCVVIERMSGGENLRGTARGNGRREARYFRDRLAESLRRELKSPRGCIGSNLTEDDLDVVWKFSMSLQMPRIACSNGSRAALNPFNSPIRDRMLMPRLLPLQNTRREVAWSEHRAVRAAEPPSSVSFVNSEIHIIETTTTSHRYRSRRRSLHPSTYRRIIQSLPSPHEVHSQLQGSAVRCPHRYTPRACSSIAQRTRPLPLQPVPHSRFLTMLSLASPRAVISREEEVQPAYNPWDQ